MDAESPPTEAYADNTVFVETLGDHPKTRILSVLLAAHEQEVTASDLSRRANIEQSTLSDQIGTLLDYGLVTVDHTDQEELYTLNKDSRATKALGRFQWRLLDIIDKEGEPADGAEEHKK